VAVITSAISITVATPLVYVFRRSRHTRRAPQPLENALAAQTAAMGSIGQTHELLQTEDDSRIYIPYWCRACGWVFLTVVTMASYILATVVSLNLANQGIVTVWFRSFALSLAESILLTQPVSMFVSNAYRVYRVRLRTAARLNKLQAAELTEVPRKAQATEITKVIKTAEE